MSDAGPRECDRLLRHALSAGASDLHLQPRLDGSAEASLRLDGVLCPLERIPAESARLVIGRIKYLARLRTWESTVPQDGRIEGADSGLDTELRVSTYPTVSGEKVVVRFFQEERIRRLEDLGLGPGATSRLEGFLAGRRGLLLLTGPSGSGKTTTIYACLRHLSELDSRHVITVEDPVEQRLDGIMQTEVNEARGLDYPRALRHLLRQDPETIVVGEIRDERTAGITLRAALTGHQVIATLHAGSCKGVVDRLRVMVGDDFALASGLELIVNQRLVRRLCPSCLGEGCSACSSTGYRGRVPMAECLQLSDRDRQLLKQGRGPASRPDPALEESARILLEGGLTDRREIGRIGSR